MFCKQIFYEWISLNLQSIITWNYNVKIWRAVTEKNNKFIAHKIFFWCSIILFLSARNTFSCYINFLLLTWNIFSCSINMFLSKPNYFLWKVKLFISTQNYFSCNTKFLFWTSFRMLCYGDILLLSHSNKNIITCQKINKLSILYDTKKLISFFKYDNFLMHFFETAFSYFTENASIYFEHKFFKSLIML